MNRLVALLLLLLVVTNAAWMIYGRPPAREDLPPSAPTVETTRDRPDAHEEVLTAEIVRLKERLARYERPRNASPALPDPARVANANAAEQKAKARNEMWAAADEQSKKWVAAMKQIEDPSLRARAIEDVRAALASPEDGTLLAGLQAVSSSWGVEIDRDAFRALVLPRLGSSDPMIRSIAVRAFAATKPGRDEIELILPLAHDPDSGVLRVLPGVLVRMSEYRPDGAPGRALVGLLSHEDRGVRDAALDAMNHVRELTPELEEKLVSMASSTDRRERRKRERTLFALGRVGKKSDRVIDLFLPYLEEDNYNARLVAYRGLQSGIPESSKKKVADAIVAAAPKLPDHNNLMMCFRILNQCADKSHLEAMERLAANPMLSESLQKSLKRWLEDLRRHVGS